MEAAGEALASLGLTLRSGGAYGADTAFEKGCNAANGPKEIYIPWNGFNDRHINEGGVMPLHTPVTEHSCGYPVNYDEAEKLAKDHHPAWNKLSPGIKPLLIRNSYQIMGRDMQSPCLFVLCWTPNGSGQGGTGQAIRIARAHNIPVFENSAYLCSSKNFFRPKPPLYPNPKIPQKWQS